MFLSFVRYLCYCKKFIFYFIIVDIFIFLFDRFLKKSQKDIHSSSPLRSVFCRPLDVHTFGWVLPFTIYPVKGPFNTPRRVLFL